MFVPSVKATDDCQVSYKLTCILSKEWSVVVWSNGVLRLIQVLEPREIFEEIEVT